SRELGGQRADLGAQRRHRLLALRRELRVTVLDDPGRFHLGLLARLGDDRGPLLAGLLADLRRRVAGVGDLRLELPLRGLGVLARLVSLRELLADRLLTPG